MRILLTIAGFDPSSGAGVTADLQVFAAHGLFGCSAITAMTVQSTLGVRRSRATDADLLAETLSQLAQDLPPAGIKIGMLATREIVAVVADFLEASQRERKVGPVVLDPVFRSSSGAPLLEDRGIDLCRDRLLGLVDWITPNWNELKVLGGIPVRTVSEAEDAAGRLAAKFGGLSVVATGGEMEQPTEIVVYGGEAHRLEGERITSESTHGTGCAFSSALLCNLVDGKDGFMAADAAKRYVAEAIRRATPLGRGKGPMNLLWPLGTASKRESITSVP